VKDGWLVYEKAWGNIRTYDEEGIPVSSEAVTPDTLYDLASNTKMYSVNYALQYLVTEGKLDLDTKIADILGPAFAEYTIRIDYEGCEPVGPEIQKKWKSELTVRDLLKHQGGFPPGPQYFNDRYDHASLYFDSDSGNVIYTGTGADEKTREETLKAIFKTPLMYEPGTKTVYSDVDYMVLCYCAEKITGMRLDAYLQKTFWEPLGLKHICYNPLENGFEKKDCAATELMGNTRAGRLHYTGIRTYTLQGEVHDPNAYYCMDGVSGHAGMFSNASDLAVLASVMLSGGYGEHRFFSKDVIAQFTAPSDSTSPDYFDDYLAARVDTSKDGNDPDFLEWTRETNRDNVVTLVRDIMKKMTDPCKTLFNYIYFGDGGKRMSVKDIMKQMPDRYTNEASVRNQTSRCNKKFRETYLRLRNLL
jgi:CubicO group peptidase (beta-lactamase class C family)